MKIQSLLDSASQKQIFPGAVFGICTPTSSRIWKTGTFTYESGSPHVNEHTLYDVASITKSIPTSCLTWKLIEENRLSLDQPVQTVLPEWKGEYKDKVLLWHLLAHAVQYENASLAKLSSVGKERLQQKILEMPLREPPGRSFFYVNTNSILLGWMLERVTGRPLTQLSQEYFWRPLNMHNTTFLPSKEQISRTAPTERDSKTRTVLQGIVHDESARVLSRMGQVVGSAGVFSSVPDLLVFLQTLLNKTESLFGPKTLGTMFTPVHLESGKYVGLGWEYNNQEWMGDMQSPCFGKTGFTGCFCAVFPRLQLGAVMLSNVIHPQRPKNRTQLNDLRKHLLRETVLSVYS
jgi:CubicO group peptidase (beta-lactamase class C family)